LSKTIGLKELPDIYISSGMSLSEVCKYINIPEKTVKKWEKFFDLAPKTISGVEKVYTKDKIQEFIKIKKFLDRGRTLEEIRIKVYKMPVEVTSQPVSNSHPEHLCKNSESITKSNQYTTKITDNPFEKARNFSEFKPEEQNMKPYNSSSFEIKPFLSQLHIANEKIGDLILEKAKIVEDTAIEKVDLLTKINSLKIKNKSLLEEKQNIFDYIQDKKEQIERFSSREDILSKALMISQEILNKKEDEIIQLRGSIKAYEQEIQGKSDLIQEQSLEIDAILKKQTKKWWKFWKK